jgi:hypothetical protein
MTSNNQSKINYLVSFLNRNDKDKLVTLKQKFEEFQDYLEPGVIMETDEISPKIAEYKFRLEVCNSGLLSIFKDAEKKVSQLRIKLKNLNNLQLVSQLIVLLSGATILLTLQNNFGENYTWLKYIAPSLVLIASILTIWAKNKSESFLTGNKNLYESTSNLITLKNQANFLLAEITIIQKYFDLEKAKATIEAANDIAKKMIDEIEKQ